jgi:hypothetical protein
MRFDEADDILNDMMKNNTEALKLSEAIDKQTNILLNDMDDLHGEYEKVFDYEQYNSIVTQLDASLEDEDENPI